MGALPNQSNESICWIEITWKINNQGQIGDKAKEWRRIGALKEKERVELQVCAATSNGTAGL